MHSTLRLIAFSAALFAATAHAEGIFLTLLHAYGAGTGAAFNGTTVVYSQSDEFLDAGTTHATVHVLSLPGYRGMIDLHLDCARSADVVRAGEEIAITAYGARVAPMFASSLPGCVTNQSVTLGALPAGRYRVQARVVLADGTSVSLETVPLEVLPLAGRCNPLPQAAYTVAVRPPPPQTAEAFAARLAADAAFAASLDSPAVVAADEWVAPYDMVALRYAPLRDPSTVIDLVSRAGVLGEFLRPNVDDWYACWGYEGDATVKSMVEFYRAQDDRYFYTGDSREIEAIEAGAVGAGWARTGRSFAVIGAAACPSVRKLGVVYRFTGVPGVGPDTHFFTHDRSECHAVDASGRWQFEGVAFWARPALAGGGCETATQVIGRANVPLFRLWRPYGTSTHRFTTDPGVVAEMTARGWVAEGTAMCVLSGQ